MRSTIVLLSIALSVLAAPSTIAQVATRSLENVTGDVWQFTNDRHQSAVVVTEEGVVRRC